MELKEKEVEFIEKVCKDNALTTVAKAVMMFAFTRFGSESFTKEKLVLPVEANELDETIELLKKHGYLLQCGNTYMSALALTEEVCA